ncbi:Predicted Zn-dependent peptidase [Malonomonas rubra DSM 5091]|uniref:Predicted Zn-dependent peptidase n=1 Tax=Malonomonas rubra DSM 5091 TaxID=1122189 RepID=A0A1M6BJE9_MALRU|nr:pitrilysin family protein [Malonomonas rubra]SHI48910.1 Predicted Zn-dependent peptidase [Malonomonas rubra DSM 5091]
MLKIFMSFFFLALLQPFSLSAQTLAEKVQEHKLDNGLTLLMVERHSSPTVSAYISFRVGAVDEDSSHRGVAHLLEHMLFKGTKTLGTKDFSVEAPQLEKIAQLGAQIDALKNLPDRDEQELQGLREQLAELQQQHRDLVVKDEFSKIYAENGGVGYNAFTSKDQTTYLINLPANKLELWAVIESDRLKNAVLREFYTEREVIREERRRSYESSPGGMLYETLLATAYKVHPYRDPIIGWDSDIKNLTLEETREFLHNYYSPVNMVITLVGDFDSQEAKALVERYFGSLEPGIPVPPVVEVEPPQTGERRARVTFDAEPQLMIAYHKPTMPAREDYVFDILMQVLGEGRTSRLYKSLVVDQQVATDVSVFSSPGSRYANLMTIMLTPRATSTTVDVEAAVYAELKKLQDQPISAAELQKARRQILTSILRGLKGNSGLARMLSAYEILGGWEYLVDYEEKLNSVTAEEVMQVAKNYLQANNRTVVGVGREDFE